MKTPTKTILALLVAGSGAWSIWMFRQQSSLPQVPFARPTRQDISSTLSTNGKIEPIEFADVRVEISGLVKRLLVHQGDSVRKGRLIAELSQPGTAEELSAAEARVAQARAELATLQAGGRGSDAAELDGNLNRLRAQRDAAQQNLAALDRLVQANAATKFEADQARQAVRDIDAQMQTLGQRKGSLVGANEVAAAQARVREAGVSVRLANTHLALTSAFAPIGGVVYDLPARMGAFLHAGDALASIGKPEPVRVRVYVDEPELGRVAPGEPLRITWDALPGREWTGTVEKRPSEVVALGSRQVGEVLCSVGNPGHDLLPGTNVNAFILTQVARHALTIPKSAVRRDSGVGVYVLDRAGQAVRWQAVKTGASDALRVEIVSGLGESDLVAQPTDAVLKNGAKVNPVMQQEASP